jgi:cell division protein FtsQ
MRAPETLPVRKVHFISRIKHLDPLDLRNAVMSELRGGFFTVDLRAIERSLESLAWVEAAAARRQWPDTVLIRLGEQKAVARWGNEGLLNPRGEVFHPDQINQSVGDLPILFGPEGHGKELIKRFEHFYELLFPLGLRLRALVQDERRAWHMLLANGVKVALGRGEASRRLRRFLRVYPKVLAPRISEVVSIDLRYTNGIAVAWRWNKNNAQQLKSGGKPK